MRKLPMVLLGAAACAALIAISTSTIEAGGKGARPAPTGSEWCAVSPNPVSNGLKYTVTGGGFRSGEVLSLRVDGSILMTAADGTGAISAWDWANFRIAGTKEMKIFEQGDRKMTVLASCSFIANGK